MNVRGTTVSEFKAQDVVTINRGKLAGEQGRVLDVSADGTDLAVKLDNGKVMTLKASQVRKPPAPSITRDELASVIQAEVSAARPEALASVRVLVQRLEGQLPGLDEAITWPASEDEDEGYPAVAGLDEDEDERAL